MAWGSYLCFVKMSFVKWLRYQRVISLETQVEVKSQMNKWAHGPGPAGDGIRCLGGVSIPC
jgi:hypothetical protein